MRLPTGRKQQRYANPDTYAGPPDAFMPDVIDTSRSRYSYGDVSHHFPLKPVPIGNRFISRESLQISFTPQFQRCRLKRLQGLLALYTSPQVMSHLPLGGPTEILPGVKSKSLIRGMVIPGRGL